MKPTKPVNNPDSSIFDGTVGTIVLAAITGVMTTVVVFLSNVFAAGTHFVPVLSALKYGAGMFGLILVVNLLPSKIAPWFILVMIMVMSFFFFPTN